MDNPLLYSRSSPTSIQLIEVIVKKHSSLLTWSSEPESILDLGIGDGSTTKKLILPLLPPNVKEFIGADISEAMLECANETINYNHFKTIQLDAKTKTFPGELKNRFDHIFSNLLFHHIQDTRQLFVNIMDMLKPGGQLFFNTFEKLFLDYAFDKLDQGKWAKYNNRKARSPFHDHENPLKGYEAIIKDVGFVDCHLFSEPIASVRSEKIFEDVCVAINHRLPCVEENDKKEYLEDYIRECKNSRIVSIFDNGGNEQKLFQCNFNVITGIISKPLRYSCS